MNDVYLPLYCKDPFQLIRYEVREFTANGGKTGKVRVAIYCKKKDFNSSERVELEMDAQVMWN